MVVETLFGRDPDISTSMMLDGNLDNGIHAVIPTEEKVLAGFVPHVQDNMAAMGFFTGRRNGEVVVEGKPTLRRVEHPNSPGKFMTELGLQDGGAWQSLVRVAPVEIGEGVEVSFYDRYAPDGMIPLEVDAKQQGRERIPEPVILGDPSKDNRHTRSAEQELRDQVTYAVDQAVNRAKVLQQHLHRNAEHGSAIPRPENWAATFAQAEVASIPEPVVVYQAGNS